LGRSAVAIERRAMETHSFFSLDGLTDLGLRSGVDMRPTLLRVLTDLYVQRLRHTPDEERHYTELALRLLEAVDMPTRIAVAARLARHLSPPLQVLQYLAGDLPEVVAALRSHPLLQPSAPVDATQLHLAATPVAAGDAADEEYLFVDAPGEIDSATAVELNELFFAANANERRLILLNLEIVAPVPAGHLGVSLDPSVGQRLEAAALARGREDFAQQLVASLQIPREQARRIVRDDLGEPVAVAAKALGVPRNVLYRILMFVNPAVGHSVERVHGLAALYDEMTARAAESMVAIWQALQKNERAETKYQPVTRDDQTRLRARPATAVQRTPAAQRTGERRSAS
jgi:hypothetical protein